MKPVLSPARVRSMFKRYGLTLAAFMRIWRRQRGRCAICNKPFRSARHAHIEHAHKKAAGYRVRGLACFYCNMKFLAPLERGGIERLRRAVVYLGWQPLDR